VASKTYDESPRAGKSKPSRTKKRKSAIGDERKKSLRGIAYRNLEIAGRLFKRLLSEAFCCLPYNLIGGEARGGLNPDIGNHCGTASLPCDYVFDSVI